MATKQKPKRTGRPPILKDAVPFNLYLEDKQLRKLEKEADKKGVSIAHVIRGYLP